MDPRLAAVAAIVAKNTALVGATLAGIDDAHYRSILLPDTSPMGWILGHITGSRHLASRLLGGRETYAHAERFARGAAVGDPATLPAAAELLPLWERMGAVLADRFAAADTAALDAETPVPVPSTDGTVLGTVTFLTLHETYHLGQLGLLRKALGYPGLAG